LRASLVNAQETTPAGTLAPLGTEFTYQGELQDGDGPVTALCDFQFKLWDAATVGAQIGSTQSANNVSVSNGLFSALLNESGQFGSSAFVGDARWLELAVRCPAGAGTFTALTPRQVVAATPYALYSQASAWSGLTGVPADFADGADDDTTYTAGTGLTLSGGAFQVQFGGTGSSASASRSDHNHGGENWVGGSLYGLRIENNTTNALATGILGVVVESNNSAGIDGRHESLTGSGRGVFGASKSSVGIGTSGFAASLTGTTTGMYGSAASPNGIGVSGYAASLTGNTRGVFGSAESPDGVGVSGYAASPTGAATGVLGGSESSTGTGVAGIAYATSGVNAGIYGTTNSPDGWAGFFAGNVHINGTLSKSAGSFRIDHPLDPENKYLSHSFVESPDMMNVYNGNVTLDANGEGLVDLPSYFEALNKDFRYQLTAIGAPGPNLYIAEPVSNNRFKIAGGTPGLVVSWQVTGVRQDEYALENPIIVEEDKPAEELGTFSAPQALGQSEEQGFYYEQQIQSEMSEWYTQQQSPSIQSSGTVSNTWENR
jgi:hypothetical protein